MAVKIYLDTDVETKKDYDEQVMRETQKASYFDKFKKKDGSSIIFTKQNLLKGQGDTIYFYLTKKLDDSQYFTQGQTITGNEQKLDSFRDSVSLEERSIAVAYEGGLSEKRPVFQISDESHRALVEAGASHMDQMCFDALYAGTPTKIFQMAATPAAGGTVGAILATDLLTPKKISYIKTGALTGWNRSQEPFKPVMIDGKPHYVILTHPDALFDLKQDSQYQQYLRDAEIRGKDNPLFTGAVALVDGVIIHESERIFISKKGGVGSNVAYAKTLLMGQNALVWADGKREEIVMEQRNYKKITGYCWTLIAGTKRVTFNSKDWAVAELLTARTQISD